MSARYVTIESPFAKINIFNLNHGICNWSSHLYFKLFLAQLYYISNVTLLAFQRFLAVSDFGVNNAIGDFVFSAITDEIHSIV